MKKFLFLFAFTAAVAASQAADAATITVTYQAGQWCKGNGSNCTITVKYDLLVAAPPDVNPVQVPQGFHLATLQTGQWDHENFEQPSMTFGPNETSDGSTISVPAQTYQWSQQLQAYVVYAR